MLRGPRRAASRPPTICHLLPACTLAATDFFHDRSPATIPHFATFSGWSYDEGHLIDVCRPRLRLFRLEVFVSDVGFDSNKHDLTRQDAQKGAESLKTAADGINTFADAQVESVWGDEAGVDAARRALRAAYQAVGEGYATESTIVLDFGGKVDESEAEFLRMEGEKAGYFSQASTALTQDPAVAAAAAGVSGSGSSSSAGSSNGPGSSVSTGASYSGSQGEEDSNADPNSDF